MKELLSTKKRNLLLKITLFTLLQLFTINVIKMNWKTFTKDNYMFQGLGNLDLGRKEIQKLIKIQ